MDGSGAQKNGGALRLPLRELQIKSDQSSECNLRPKLHGASIVGKDQIRTIECIGTRCQKGPSCRSREIQWPSNQADSIRLIDAARNVLGMIEDVEGLGREFEAHALCEAQTFH